MTSNNLYSKDTHTYEYKIPILDGEVKKACDEDGVYKINLPELKGSELKIDGKKAADTIQLRCQSCYVKHPDTICKCNSTVKTIVGGGTGDQCEIIECGKCRTSYLVRTRYDAHGHLKLNVSVWDTGRNIKSFSRREHNENLDFLLRFNKEKQADDRA